MKLIQIDLIELKTYKVVFKELEKIVQHRITSVWLMFRLVLESSMIWRISATNSIQRFQIKEMRLRMSIMILILNLKRLQLLRHSITKEANQQPKSQLTNRERFLLKT